MLEIQHTVVFAATPEGGNPCPVVFGGQDLSTEQMQALAANFGHETAFVLPPTRPAADLRLRYFVPNNEMEMCVHATVGVITLLVRQGRLTQSPIQVEIPLGLIEVSWEIHDDVIIVRVEQFPPTFSDHNPPLPEVAKALGIRPSDIAVGLAPLQTVSTSRPKLLVPVTDFRVLDSIEPDYEVLWGLCDQYSNTGFYPFTVQTRKPGWQIEARQFPKRAGYPEDPATGVAACALGAYLTKYAVFEPLHTGWHNFTIGQGFAMGKPSYLEAATWVENGQITRTFVKGQAIIIEKLL